MTTPKELKKPTRLKRQLIRARQNVPSASLMIADRLIGRASSFSATPYPLSAESFSPSYFILGSGRSGNTLLRRMLMEDFDTFIPPEMPGLGKSMRKLVQTRYRNWETCSRAFFMNFEASANINVRNPENGVVYNLWAELGLSTTDLMRQAAAIQHEARACAALITLLYHNILSNADFQATCSTVIGDKTPWNVMYTHQLEGFFPKARFVLVVRHPLAVAYSYVKGLSAVNGISLDDAARRWSLAQFNCLDLARRVGSDRIHVTQYENLVTSKVESSRVGAFLQLPEGGGCVSGLISEADAKLMQHKRINQPIDSSSVDRWKTEIIGDTKKRLLSIVEPALIRLACEIGIDYRADL